MAPSPGRLVAIKAMRRQHAVAGQKVRRGFHRHGECVVLPDAAWHSWCCPVRHGTSYLLAACLGLRRASGARPHAPPTPPVPQEARALRYVHGCAPGGAAPGAVRLLDSFSFGAHYCLVTGAPAAAAAPSLLVTCLFLKRTSASSRVRLLPLPPPPLACRCRTGGSRTCCAVALMVRMIGCICSPMAAPPCHARAA